MRLGGGSVESLGGELEGRAWGCGSDSGGGLWGRSVMVDSLSLGGGFALTRGWISSRGAGCGSDSGGPMGVLGGGGDASGPGHRGPRGLRALQ
eukprot:653127-Prorocentrum_minimum.AAC.1